MPDTNFWCFDEIHKFQTWRDFLKGVYDEFHDSHKILVTGSARLDMLRKSGDSLQGRYHHLRLHPLTVNELQLTSQEEFIRLLNLGGFPEPYFSNSEIEAKRWSTNYRSLLVTQESPSIENIFDLSKLELLSLRLPELVGSPLSLDALREDLQVAHKTVDQLVNQEMEAGEHLVPWNGTDTRGQNVPSGVYFYRMETNDYSEAKRMVLIR